MNTSCVYQSKGASAHRQIHVYQQVHVNTNNKTDLQIQICEYSPTCHSDALF